MQVNLHFLDIAWVKVDYFVLFTLFTGQSLFLQYGRVVNIKSKGHCSVHEYTSTCMGLTHSAAILVLTTNLVGEFTSPHPASAEIWDGHYVNTAN